MASKRFFEWINGESRGTVTTLVSMYKDGEEVFYEFADGEEVSAKFVAPMMSTLNDLKGKFLVEVESPNNMWEFVEIRDTRVDLGRGNVVTVPPLNDIMKGGYQQKNFDVTDSDIGKLKLTPPSKQIAHPLPLPKLNEWCKTPVAPAQKPTPTPTRVVESVVNVVEPVVEQRPIQQQAFVEKEVVVTPQPVVQEPQPQVPNNGIYVDETHPVSILVRKAKKHTQEVELSLDMMLPSPDLFRLAASEFDDGSDVFIDNIIKDLDIETIVNALRVALIDAYSGGGGGVDYTVDPDDYIVPNEKDSH